MVTTSLAKQARLYRTLSPTLANRFRLRLVGGDGLLARRETDDAVACHLDKGFCAGGTRDGGVGVGVVAYKVDSRQSSVSVISNQEGWGFFSLPGG